MKNICFLLIASLILASCGPTTVVHSDNYQPAPAPPPVMEVSYQSFYDQLSPYGNWVNYPGYGYVWMPNAGPDFRPYATNGNWIYTEAGWTWASNYSWGWAPFHYGRWFFENGYGWIWVPGNEWAPAWVSWRGGGDYYGWAPLGPRVSADMALSNYNPPAYYWNFVPRQYIGNPGWHNYYVNQNRNVTIINNTTIINNYSGTNRGRYIYAPGPDPVEVRRVSGNSFTPMPIREANTPGERISGNQFTIYHPRVANNPAATRNESAGRPSGPAPARYESFNNVRPSNQYRMNDQPPVNNQQPANPRPAMQNTGYNQPNNNSQPAGNRPQNPNYAPPVNNQPANNPTSARPAGNNQPVNNTPAGRPTGNPALPAQSPVNSQPSNNRTQDAVSGTTHPPANRDLNKARMNQASRNPAQTGNRNVQPGTPPHATAQNQVQPTGHPVTEHNPNNGHPVQRTPAPAPKPAVKPDEKPVEPPKTREANNN
jgi:hypothetical protein